MSYRTCQSVRYRYWCTKLTEVSGTGVDLVSKLPKCPVPVLMSYRTYRSVRYRYWCTELTEVSGTGINVVPNLPKCPLPVMLPVILLVIPAVCLCTYRTEHTLLCMLFKRYHRCSEYTRYSEYTRSIEYFSYSEYWEFASTGSIKTRSTWSMGSCDGLNTASNGSMSSTYSRVQAVPAV